ncbi:hypothetical protein RRG08_039321 [Elysia crispata]|uniref:Uncharacterized protein n=1 Tax=Elysia crispata TaxID=231223 RepID=A0AAE1D2W6_9GAST|nr:hypothetical protein RRG08_039321 [Elysia crispata]
MHSGQSSIWPLYIQDRVQSGHYAFRTEFNLAIMHSEQSSIWPLCMSFIFIDLFLFQFFCSNPRNCRSPGTGRLRTAGY